MPLAAAGIGAGASLLGGLFGSNAASDAADAQAQAAKYAADVSRQNAKDALQFQQWQYGTERNDFGPWLSVGQRSIASLYDQLTGGGFPDWTGKFVAPTDITEQNDPGFQARLKMGTDALQNSAAAKGNLLTGGTARALTNYAQDFASNEYGNVYGRAFNEYQQQYNQFQQNQANRFNRYAALAQGGQQVASTLGQLGQNAAQNVSNTLNYSGQQIGNDLMAAGNARATGYINSANAWNNALGGAANGISTYALMQQLMNQNNNPPGGGSYI